MEKAEATAGLERCMEVPLSMYMRESWETGRFWLSHAGRKSWAFDTLFWKFSDERFFGIRQNGVPRVKLWKTTLHLQSEAERIAIEPFGNGR